ncbi:DMT family transporter [Variovorax sp. YR752]|uniref:DMT family transporter n=1 Tax=Variovorax sp. YR752 TaxID=1884383 RepID=UPI0031380961
MTGSAAQPFMLMLAFATAWVLLEEVVGARLQAHYPLLQIVWCRYAAHLVILLVLFGWREPVRLWRTRRPVFQLTRSLLMLVMPLSFALSLGAGLDGAVVWALFWCVAPLLMLAGARWWLGEAVPALAWVAAAAGGMAALLLFSPAPPQAVTRLVLPLVMALSFAAYVLMTRGLRFEDVRANLFYTAFGVFAVLTPFMPSMWVAPGAHDALVLMAIGAVGLLSLLALDRAAALGPLGLSTPALTAHLLALIAVGWALDGHAPTRRAAVGGLMLIGVLWYFWRRHASAVAGAPPQAVEEGTR